MSGRRYIITTLALLVELLSVPQSQCRRNHLSWADPLSKSDLSHIGGDEMLGLIKLTNGDATKTEGNCETIKNQLTGNGTISIKVSKVCPRINLPWRKALEETISEEQYAWFDSLRPKLTDSTKRRIRKDVRYVTEKEFSDIVDAVYNLKNDYIDGNSKYQILMDCHVGNAHDPPVFFIWHREYMLRLENALRAYKDTITIPYWDVPSDYYLPSPKDSVVWSGALFGNGDGLVATGRFAAWETPKWNCKNLLVPADGYVWRQVGTQTTSYIEEMYFYSDADMKYVFGEKTYHNFNIGGICFSWMHGDIHNFIGGIMAPSGRGPIMEAMGCEHTLNPLWDPISIFFHSYFDYTFSQWRAHGQRTDVETDWIDNYAYPTCHESTSKAYSFKNQTFGDLLTSDYDAMVGFEVRNVACKQQNECTSDYTWCSLTYRRCLSKIIDGGDCSGLPHNACVSGTCETDDNKGTSTCLVSSKIKIIN